MAVTETLCACAKGEVVDLEAVVSSMEPSLARRSETERRSGVVSTRRTRGAVGLEGRM